jgi:pimeloyl-ACP methyl ester carboxylesterase
MSTFFKVFPLRFINILPFHRSAAHGMSYWYRPHKSKTQRPIVFIHGLGVGMIQYSFWFRTLPPDVGVIAVEMLPIAGRVTTYPLASTPELIKMIVTCVAQQRDLHPDGAWDDFVLVGNSYGTLLMSPLLQHPDIAHRVAASVLVDPVSLLLHLPDVAYNFTRKQPKHSALGRAGYWYEWFIWFGSATDAGTAHALSRRFCWRESLLWRELLTPSLGNYEFQQTEDHPSNKENSPAQPRVGMRSTVVLGSEDCVTHPTAVASYVYSGDVHWTAANMEEWKRYEWTGREELELLYLYGFDHGFSITVPIPSPRLAMVIHEYCKKDDGFSAHRDLEASQDAMEAGGEPATDIRQDGSI